MSKLLFVFVLFGMVARAQNPARVTIYTPGGFFKGALRHGETLGIGEQPTLSQGQIFDGDTKLAGMLPGRFVTFELTPGVHLIGTALTEKKTRSEVSIDATPDSRYFLRLTATSKGAWVVQLVRSHLEIVTCDEARKDADKTKPLQAKMIDKDARNQVVDATYFPRCQ